MKKSNRLKEIERQRNYLLEELAELNEEYTPYEWYLLHVRGEKFKLSLYVAIDGCEEDASNWLTFEEMRSKVADMKACPFPVCQ